MNTNWNDPNFQGFSGENPFEKWKNRPKKERKPIGTPLGRTMLNLLVTLLFAGIYYYVALPALNIHSGDLYVFIVLLCGVYALCAVLTSGFQGQGAKNVLFGGEGIFHTVVTGPGRVTMQTMSMNEFVRMIAARIPQNNN